MISCLLDPWSDAAEIAARLALPSARLVVVLGAESWCQTCRTFRPVFESVAERHAGANDSWLWFDLEEHAEFIDDFIPDNLPLLIRYEGPNLTHALFPRVLTALALVDLLGLPRLVEHDDLPDIRARLMNADWAA